MGTFLLQLFNAAFEMRAPRGTCTRICATKGVITAVTKIMGTAPANAAGMAFQLGWSGA